MTTISYADYSTVGFPSYNQNEVAYGILWPCRYFNFVSSDSGIPSNSLSCQECSYGDNNNLVCDKWFCNSGYYTSENGDCTECSYNADGTNPCGCTVPVNTNGYVMSSATDPPSITDFNSNTPYEISNITCDINSGYSGTPTVQRCDSPGSPYVLSGCVSNNCIIPENIPGYTINSASVTPLQVVYDNYTSSSQNTVENTVDGVCDTLYVGQPKAIPCYNNDEEFILTGCKPLPTLDEIIDQGKKIHTHEEFLSGLGLETICKTETSNNSDYKTHYGFYFNEGTGGLNQSEPPETEWNLEYIDTDKCSANIFNDAGDGQYLKINDTDCNYCREVDKSLFNKYNKNDWTGPNTTDKNICENQCKQLGDNDDRKISEESNDCVKLPNCIYKEDSANTKPPNPFYSYDICLPGNTLTNQNIKEKYDNLNDIDKEKIINEYKECENINFAIINEARTSGMTPEKLDQYRNQCNQYVPNKAEAIYTNSETNESIFPVNISPENRYICHFNENSVNTNINYGPTPDNNLNNVNPSQLPSTGAMGDDGVVDVTKTTWETKNIESIENKTKIAGLLVENKRLKESILSFFLV